MRPYPFLKPHTKGSLHSVAKCLERVQSKFVAIVETGTNFRVCGILFVHLDHGSDGKLGLAWGVAQSCELDSCTNGCAGARLHCTRCNSINNLLCGLGCAC